MKRIIVYILIMTFCLQFLPKEVFSDSVVKQVDVIFNDLNLQVNGKGFSHKKTITYENQIYIPMNDLAKELSLKYRLINSNRTIYLNSNGKLNLEDTSAAYIAYQRGYEINTKNKLMKDLQNLIEGKQGKIKKVKEKNTIKVGTDNIKVYLDSKELQLYPSPILYNNDIYVEVASISRDLLITPIIKNNNIDFDTNAVLKQENSHRTQEFLAKLRDGENNRLSKLLQEMNKKKKIMLDLKLPYMEVNSVKDMNRYLNKYFAEIEINDKDSVRFDVDITKNSNNSYYLDISIISGSRSNWYKLDKRQVQAYIWDLYIAITNLLDDEAKIQGAIRNPNSSSRDYVTFDTRYKDLNFNFTNSRLDLKQKIDVNYIKDLLDKYKGSIYRYDRFKFNVRISGYDLEIIIEDIDGLYFEKWSIQSRVDFLESIKRIVHRQYPDLKIVGKIFYKDQSSGFTMDDGVESNDLILDLNKRLNKDYSFTIKNGTRINMTYTLSETNNQINLMAYADISQSDEKWDDAIKQEINLLLDRILREVLSIFDKDVVVKIFDKDGKSINDYGVFKNTVASVRANPKSGEILSSQKIELLSDTEGATIYYTTDGTNPSISSTRYNGGFTIAEDTTIKAFAIKHNMKDSVISTFTFKVVSDKNVSSGLDNLEIRPQGSLSPDFTRLNKNYTLNLGSRVNSITLTPIAKVGTIKIDGREVKSGESITIDIIQNRQEIEIIHKEDNKVEFTYMITVSKSTSPSDVNLEVSSFITSIVGSFKGYLTSGTVNNFNGYSVVLKTKSDKVVATTQVNSEGEFAAKFNINVINNIIGYKYEVIYEGKVVDEGELN